MCPDVYMECTLCPLYKEYTLCPHGDFSNLGDYSTPASLYSTPEALYQFAVWSHSLTAHLCATGILIPQTNHSTWLLLADTLGLLQLFLFFIDIFWCERCIPSFKLKLKVFAIFFRAPVIYHVELKQTCASGKVWQASRRGKTKCILW